jgi:hypothetical protein
MSTLPGTKRFHLTFPATLKGTRDIYMLHPAAYKRKMDGTVNVIDLTVDRKG